MGGVNSFGTGSGYGTAAAPAQQFEIASPKHTGYGLPCARCRTYYAADLAACPVCHYVQRVSPLEPLPDFAPAEQLPDPEELEQERERFLQEFNAQMSASPLPAERTGAALHCTRQEQHLNSPEPATVCQSCFDGLEERVDVLEAALHIDIKEAAQIVYDAVWADPSDPSKTYQNAAQALLMEIRRRAGIVPVFGQLTPPSN
jgi:hypothetical protein